MRLRETSPRDSCMCMSLTTRAPSMRFRTSPSVAGQSVAWSSHEIPKARPSRLIDRSGDLAKKARAMTVTKSSTFPIPLLVTSQRSRCLWVRSSPPPLSFKIPRRPMCAKWVVTFSSPTDAQRVRVTECARSHSIFPIATPTTARCNSPRLAVLPALMARSSSRSRWKLPNYSRTSFHKL